MKKLFMFLAVAGLATFGASCSSDDGGTPPPPDKVLTAKASPSTVEVNKEVTFSATSEGKAVDGVSFYLGETKLNNPHKFDAKGTYKVVAKKEGFKESAAITVTVTEAGNPGDGEDGEKKTLTLTIAPAEVTLGQSVTFIVMEGTANVTADAEIYVNGALNSGSTYTATEVGEYAVVAKKEGANDSVEKTFTVVEAPVVPESNFFAAGSDIENIEEVRLYAHANAQNQILLYSDIVEGKDMAIFELVSFGDDEGIFSMMIAVEQPEDAEGIITPKLAVDLGLMHGPLGAYAAFGSGAEVDATQEAGFGYNFVADANGASVPGNVVFGLEDTALEAAYEGEFRGLFALNVAAKGVKSSKAKYINAISKVVK